MAWIFFQDTEELKTHFADLSVPLPIVKSNEERSAFFCGECGRARLTSLLSGMTCPLCGEATSPSPSTSSQVDFLARILVLQEMERVWKESEAAYSLKSSDSLASFDPVSFSWKTSQLSLFGGLTEFSWSSLRSGMIVDGRLYQPQKLEPVTLEKESGYLDTPTVSTATYRYQRVPTLNASRHYGHGSLSILTPTASTYGYQKSKSKNAMKRLSLNGMALAGILPGHPKGSLNPEWTEQAMGLPIGATELELWEMDGSRKQLVKHSKGSLD